MLLVAGLINPEITEPVDNQLWDARSLMIGSVKPGNLVRLVFRFCLSPG